MYACIYICVSVCVCHTQPYAQQETLLFAQACQKAPRRSKASKMKKEIKFFFFSAHAPSNKKGASSVSYIYFPDF